MGEAPSQGANTGLRRRLPLELTAEQLAQLERFQPFHGSKRATLVAGLDALGRVEAAEQGRVAAEKQAEDAAKARAEAEAEASRQEAQLAALRRDERAARQRASSGEQKQRRARERAEAEAARLTGLLAAEQAERARAEAELNELYERDLAAVRCPRCRDWAPPDEWLVEADGDHDLVYHERCRTLLAYQHAR